MSTATRKQRHKDPKPQPAPNGTTERLKTVVRRLPPNLPEDVFWQSVQAWVTDDTVAWKAYYPGKFRTRRMNKEGIPSRAYIAFKTEAQVTTFSREYDGHVFRDKAGNASQAIVEYAPFQKTPTEKRKTDARNNTIDKDEDYVSFLESLKDTSGSVSLETLVAAAQLPPPPTTTPLLEALKAEKSAQKDKEAILRNHAHYKEVVVSKKEEAKKKAAAAAAAAAKQQQQPPEPPAPAPLSKKAKKATVQKAQGGEGQGQGKTQPAVPMTARSPPPAASAGHGHRHRVTKAHPGKSVVSVPTPSGASAPPAPGAVPAAADNALAGSPTPAAPAQSSRKARPVIGLGRQFEAALSGAGVGVSSGPTGERKKRDRGEHGGATAEGGKGKQRDEGPGVVVPSILQRPEAGPDMMIMQRPQSPRVDSQGHAGAEGTVVPGEIGGAGHGRGGRRGRGGRGRGGHRGG